MINGLGQANENADRLMHMQAIHPSFASHYVSLTKDSMLYKILRQPQILVNSMHKHAVKLDALPDGLRIAALASDGIIEAIEVINAKAPIIGIQWHPEHMANEDSARLYKFFVESAQTLTPPQYSE